MRTRRGLPAVAAALAASRPAGRRVRHAQPDRAGPARGSRGRPPGGHRATEPPARAATTDHAAAGHTATPTTPAPADATAGRRDDADRDRTGLLHAQGADDRHRRLPLLRPRPEGRPRRVRHGLRHRARTTRRGAPRHPLPRASVGGLGGPRQGRRERRQRAGPASAAPDSGSRGASLDDAPVGGCLGARRSRERPASPTSASRCSAARCSSCRCTTTSGTA